MTASVSEARRKDRELDDILRDLGGSRLYHNNVFRLTGLPVTASAKQVRRRREEAALMARLGTPPAPAGELPLVPAPGWDAVDAAFESLRNPVLRLVHELLWLWDAGVEDDHDHAVRRHCAVLEGAPLATPDLASGEDHPLGQRWLAAVRAWAEVLSGEDIWDRAHRRVKELDDPRLTTGTVRRLRDRLPRHIVDVHLALAVRDAAELGPEAADVHLWVLDESSFDEDLVDAALRDAVRPAEDRVRAECETAEQVAETRPDDAIDAGHTLLERTAAPLRTITGMLGVDDAVTDAIHDQVARSVNRCAVAHHNQTDAGQAALGLLAEARRLARERTTIELIDQNVAAVSDGVVLGRVADLCLAGKVDQAADRLRAWRRSTDDPWVGAEIDRVLADPMAVRTPPKNLPVRGSWFGWGAYVYGHRRTTDPDKFVSTHYLTAFFVPVFPMAAYLRDTQYFYGKVPLSRFARWWRLVALLLGVAVVVRPFQDLPSLVGFVSILVLSAAALALRRYRNDGWAEAQDNG